MGGKRRDRCWNSYNAYLSVFLARVEIVPFSFNLYSWIYDHYKQRTMEETAYSSHLLLYVPGCWLRLDGCRPPWLKYWWVSGRGPSQLCLDSCGSHGRPPPLPIKPFRVNLIGLSIWVIPAMETDSYCGGDAAGILCCSWRCFSAAFYQVVCLIWTLR